MNKGTKIAGVAFLTAIVGVGVFEINHLLSKKTAGGKLVLNLEKINIDKLAGTDEIHEIHEIHGINGISINIPKGVSISTSFSVKNPTSEKLSFTKPYIKLLWTNKDGKKVHLADSPISTDLINLNPKSNTAVNISLDAQFLDLMKTVPDAATYFLARLMGMPATRSLEAQWEFTTEGIPISDSKNFKV